MKLTREDRQFIRSRNRIRIPVDLFHDLYFYDAPHGGDELIFAARTKRVFQLLESEKYKHLDTRGFTGVFQMRMEALYGLEKQPEAVGWFAPEKYDFVDGRHPYLIAAAAEPIEPKVIDGMAVFAFDPESFRKRLHDILRRWNTDAGNSPPTE